MLQEEIWFVSWCVYQQNCFCIHATETIFFSCSISFNLNCVHNIECWHIHILESQRTRIAETTLNQRLFNVFTLGLIQRFYVGKPQINVASTSRAYRVTKCIGRNN